MRHMVSGFAHRPADEGDRGGCWRGDGYDLHPQFPDTGDGIHDHGAASGHHRAGPVGGRGTAVYHQRRRNQAGYGPVAAGEDHAQ